MICARPYQSESVDAVYDRLIAKDEPSTLAVLATGLGKTVVFGLVADRWARDRHPGRVLVLAHREELVTQARDELAGILGVQPAVEMADRWAVPAAGSLADTPPVVVASVQSLCQPRRLSRWPADEFGLIVTDEAHHVTAGSYKRIYDHFGRAKRLGVTATPKRADDLALGSVFGSVCYEMGISDAVAEGWLCPVQQRYVVVHGLELSAVRTSGDDFSDASIGPVLSGDSVLDQMVAATVELCGDEPTLIFTAARPPGEKVSQGDLYANALNDIRPGRAVFLSGETDKDVRRRELEAFERGDRQYLVGCSLFTEGFNVPKISRVVMARPTKSPVYYAQSLGRGTRTLRGVLRPEHATPDQRRLAIAASAKPSVLVIDFVGNSGTHKVMSAVDIFAGKLSADVVARAKKAVADDARNGVSRDVAELLARAESDERREKEAKEAADRQRRERREKARVKVNRVDMTQEDVDPFGTTDGPGQRAKVATDGRATRTQLEWIRSHGGFCGDNVSAKAAGQQIAEIKRRRAAGECSPKQERALKLRGLCSGPVPKAHAKALLDWLAAREWVPPAGPPKRKQMAIAAVANGSDTGYQLMIDGHRVGAVLGSPDLVRDTYRGLAAEPTAAAG